MKARGLLLVAVAVLLTWYADSTSAGLPPLTVNSAGGGNDGVCATSPDDCTLSEAIDDVAANQAIEFGIIAATDAGCNALTGVCTITPTVSLPPIDESGVTIDGYSQTGASENMLESGNDAEFRIVVRGNMLGGNTTLFSLTGGAITIQGLVINDIPDTADAMRISGDDAVVRGNFIGTNRAGGTLIGEGDDGISVSSGDNALVGGNDPGDRNLIAGFNFQLRTFGGDGAEGTTIQGNYLGTNAAGDAGLGGTNGLSFALGTNGAQVGGTAAGAGNLISGLTTGISMVASTGVTVQGNLIGTAANGSDAIGNGGGIGIANMTNIQIGGNTPAARNTISGNNTYGISVNSGSSDIRIRGNYIGTDSTGTEAVPNVGFGVMIESSDQVTIGGPSAATGNVISGNEMGGVDIDGMSLDAVVRFNLIGTTADGSAALPNGGGISSEAPAAMILDNVVSGNTGDGILVDGDGSIVRGNSVGTDTSGLAQLGNSRHGIFVRGVDVLVGGTGGSEGNTVAFNGRSGIALQSAGVTRLGGAPPTPTGVQLFSNDVYENDELGIDLGADEAVNANDEDDGDSGDNNGQNWPVLTEAYQGSTHVKGSLNSTPDTEFRVQLFASDECDTSGNGEGQEFLGGVLMTTNAEGDRTFTINTTATIAEGRLVTATATNTATGDTSEFSNCVPVGPLPTPTPTLPPGKTPTPTPKGLTPTPTDIPIETPEPTPTGTATPLPSGVTPEPTPTATPTPSPTMTPGLTPRDKLTQGDVDCDKDVDSVDALKQLRAVALLFVQQNEPCPNVNSGVPRFGDVDCDGDVDAVDALKVLRFVAALSFTQTEPCADIGEPLS